MGVQSALIPRMKLFLLLSCLCGLLHANVVTRHLDVVEGKANYRQTVTIDYDKNIQIVEVPAHNHIIHSKTIFDFNKGKLFESHPEQKTCFVRDIPEGTADLKTFDEYLQKKTVKLIANKEKRVQKAFETSRRWNVKMLKSMASEVIEECGESEIYEVVEVPMDTARKTLVENKPTKQVSAYEKMMRSGNGCQLPDECVWQTCRYGSDSCYWTVNCRPQADQPDEDCEIYHSSNLHNGNNQIHCDVCFNLQCGPSCTDVWNDPGCNNIISGGGKIKPCPEDPTYGGDCQDLSEPHCYLPEVYYPKAASAGEFKCPTGDLEKGIVHLDGTCVYVCSTGMFGGTLTCATRDGEGAFDETMYMPELCGV